MTTLVADAGDLQFGIESKFEILKDFSDNNKLKYVISWIKN